MYHPVEELHSAKCPHCGKSYYTENYTTTTCMYFPPIYRNGVNINSDRNKSTTHCTCMSCGKKNLISKRYLIMVICDRCGKKLSYQEKQNSKKVLTIYSTEAAYIGHNVDLCENCKRIFEIYKNKMESYFMVNEYPMEILNNEKYWDVTKKFNGWKYE